MRRALALVALGLATTPALAGPPERPHGTAPATAELVAAERAWDEAVRTNDVDAWRACALAFDRAAAATTGASHDEALYAEILAWKAMLSVDVRVRDRDAPPPPPALDADEQAMVGAIGAYLAGGPRDDEPELRFFRAGVLRRHGLDDAALTDYAALVTTYPRAEVAEYAANLLLDTLNLRGRTVELVAWAERMRGSAELLRGRADLAEVVTRIHVISLRKQAEALEAAGDLLGCAAQYHQAYADAPRSGDAPELLWNGGWCAERGGDVRQARADYQRLRKRFPDSELAARARARLAALPAR